MPLRAGEKRGGSLSERLPKPARFCKPIMHERPCFETPTEVHGREAQRSKVYSYGWCCLKAFCVQKARELWQRLALHTLLDPAALLHEKLPLVSFCLGLVFSTEGKQFAVNQQGLRSHTYLVDSCNEYSGAGSCIVHAEFGFQ